MSNWLTLGLAAIGVVGTLLGGLVGMWSALHIERKRQEFERDQAARTERAQAMQTARILDSALMEAEAIYQVSIVKHNRLWPDSLIVPDANIWLELRVGIAAILDPAAWITVNVGFHALDHMRAFGEAYRKLGYDNPTEGGEPGKQLTLKIRELFDPIFRHIIAARAALDPLRYLSSQAGHECSVYLG